MRFSAYKLCALARWGEALLVAVMLLAAPAQAAELPLPHRQFRVHSPGTSVHALAQTPDGYIWMGTSRGLLRSDGARLVLFEGGRTPGLPVGKVASLLVDRQGALWVGTEAAGLVMRTVQGAFQSVAGAPSKGRVTSLLQSRTGDIWVGTRAGVYRRHQGRWSQFQVTQGLPSDHVTALVLDLDGLVWVQTPLGRARWVHDAFVADDVGHGARAKPALPLRLQALGEAKLASTAWDAYRGLSTDAVLLDRRGDIWMARPGAAGLLHVTSHKRTTYTVRDGLGSNVITSLMEDAEGGVWAAGHAGGVTEIRSQRFATLAAAHGLLSDAMFAVAAAPSGAVWVAGSGGLMRIKEGQVTSWPVGKGVPLSPRFVAVQKANAVLIAGQDGQLVRFDGESFVRLQVPNKSSTVPISGLFVDEQDMVWVAFVDGSLYRMQGDSFAVIRSASLGCQNPRADDPCPTAIHSMAPRAEGGVWMASHGDGVWAYVGDKWDRLSLPRDVTGGAIFTVFEDRTGVLWIGSLAGLLRVQGLQSHRFDVETGLPSNQVFHLLQDGGGRLWLATSAGVAYLKPREIDAFVSGQSRHISAVPFGVEDGLRGEPQFVHAGPMAARGEDGRLWFASPAGLLVFEPPESWPAPAPLKVYIEQLAFDGEPQSPNRFAPTLQAPASASDLRVQFTAPAFVEPQRLRFRYRLRPSQQAWTAALGRQAHYAALPVGNHIFEVQAFRVGEPKRAAHAQVAIYVPPKIYQSLWFYILCVAVLLAVAWLWQRWIQSRSAGDALAQGAGTALGAHRRFATLSHVLCASGWQLQTSQASSGVSSTSAQHHGQLARQTLAQAQVLVRHALAAEGDAGSFVQALQSTLDIYSHVASQLRLHSDAVSLGAAVHDELIAWTQAATSRAVNLAAAQFMALELWYTEERFELWLRHDGQPCRDALRELKFRAELAQATFCFHTAPEAGSELGVVLIRSKRLNTNE